MKPITQLAKHDVHVLRKMVGTNGKNVDATVQEIQLMQAHLMTLFTGRVTLSFAEKIVLKNKAFF